MNPAEEKIKAYLDEFAKTDKQFAEKYKNPDKSIEACLRYIISEVRKSDRVMFDDSEVYGMAIHYYDEADIVAPKHAPSCRVVVTSDHPAQRKPRGSHSTKPKSKPAGTSETVEQLTLFSMEG